MTLPEAELSVSISTAVAQLEPTLRPVFAERVAQSICRRASGSRSRVMSTVRCGQALVGLWTPPAVADPPRWSRDAPRFERASKRAW